MARFGAIALRATGIRAVRTSMIKVQVDASSAI
jgi:hypothetical protein